MCVFQAALLALENNEMFEAEIELIASSLMRLSEQKAMLESQRATIETVSALNSAAEASNLTMLEMKIDEMNKTFDSIIEQCDQMREIQEALCQPLEEMESVVPTKSIYTAQ